MLRRLHWLQEHRRKHDMAMIYRTMRSRENDEVATDLIKLLRVCAISINDLYGTVVA